MPKVSEAHLEARRGQILEAACKCLSRKGVRGSTMQDICEEASLSPGAVYRYFKGKEQIVEAIAELGRQNTRKYFESTQLSGDPTDCLVQLMSSALGLLDSERALESTRLNVRFWSEGLHSEKIRRLLVEGMPCACEPFAQVVRTGQKQRQIEEQLDADSVAMVLLAAHMGLSLSKALNPSLDLKRCMAVIAALLEGTFVTRSRHAERASDTDSNISRTGRTGKHDLTKEAGDPL